MQVMVQWKEYVVTSALVFGCTASTSEILLGQQQCLQCSSADFHTSTLCSSAECGSVEDMETIVQVISVNENPVIRLLQISSLSDKKSLLSLQTFLQNNWMNAISLKVCLEKKMRLSETKGSLADNDTNFLQTYDPTFCNKTFGSEITPWPNLQLMWSRRLMWWRRNGWNPLHDMKTTLD